MQTLNTIEKKCRHMFRTANKNSAETINLLSEIRKHSSQEHYKATISAFRISANQVAKQPLCLGTKQAGHLAWYLPAVEPLSIKKEIRWAMEWLKGNSEALNKHRRYAAEIQYLIDNDRISCAIKLIEEKIKKQGWSLWSIELKAALIQAEKGDVAQRQWLEELSKENPNSISSLLFEIFSDRNDSSYSYEMIVGKCLNSFPRYKKLAPWLSDYLKFRSLLHADDVETSFPNIISREMTSCLTDYYETLIDLITNIVCNKQLENYFEDTRIFIESLLDEGYDDSRLKKIQKLIDKKTTIHISEIENSIVNALHLREIYTKNHSIYKPIFSELDKCFQQGAMSEGHSLVMKWGLNYKSLDIGSAVTWLTLKLISNTDNTTELPISISLMSENISLDDLTIIEKDEAIPSLLNYIASKNEKQYIHDNDLLTIYYWNAKYRSTKISFFDLWLANQLIDEKNYDELEHLIKKIKSFGNFWERQADRFQIIISSRISDYENSLKILNKWLVRSPQYTFELPATTIFERKTWAIFKQYNHISVAVAAHFTGTYLKNSAILHLCKMACRAIFRSCKHNEIKLEFSAYDQEYKELVIVFLRDVWIEQNLSMCDELDTTEKVRDERIDKLQFLLNWDLENSNEYVEAIKNLTFDQTVYKGLTTIDQTRVFVNESAITRWAEKELQADYERWLTIKETNQGLRHLDEILRNYMTSPDNSEFLKEMTKNKPTAADALFIETTDRLFKRFLLDPTDGLDTYLSLRIRHGSFRGTILGPLEEKGLLYSTSGFSTEEFTKRWGHDLALNHENTEHLLEVMHKFTNDISLEIDNFIQNKIQISTPEKPHGIFPYHLNSLATNMLLGELKDRSGTFYSFISCLYQYFWNLIEISLFEIRKLILTELSVNLHKRIETLIIELRNKGQTYQPLFTTLTTVQTTIRAQCEQTADWFKLPNLSAAEKFELSNAINIAKIVTSNIYRSYPIEVEIYALPAKRIPLNTSALAVITDCIFVMLENAWKHSGLGSQITPSILYSTYDTEYKLLTIEIKSALSTERYDELIKDQLSALKEKYLGELPLKLISKEGGSGFPKLARLARSVPRSICSKPFDFGIEIFNDEAMWFTKLSVPLYEKGGVFEAYE